MRLNADQVNRLLHQVIVTREHELNCDECLAGMPEFAERELAGRTVSDALRAVQHHLALCAECGEEYEALLSALRSMKDLESFPE